MRCLCTGPYPNILTVQSVGASFRLFEIMELVRATGCCHSAEADGLTPRQLMVSLREYGWRSQRVYNFCLPCFVSHPLHLLCIANTTLESRLNRCCLPFSGRDNSTSVRTDAVSMAASQRRNERWSERTQDICPQQKATPTGRLA